MITQYKCPICNDNLKLNINLPLDPLFKDDGDIYFKVKESIFALKAQESNFHYKFLSIENKNKLDFSMQFECHKPHYLAFLSQPNFESKVSYCNLTEFCQIENALCCYNALGMFKIIEGDFCSDNILTVIKSSVAIIKAKNTHEAFRLYKLRSFK